MIEPLTNEDLERIGKVDRLRALTTMTGEMIELAAAWDEGWDAAAYDLESVEHGIVPPSNLSTNPYRKETEE